MNVNKYSYLIPLIVFHLLTHELLASPIGNENNSKAFRTSSICQSTTDLDEEHVVILSQEAPLLADVLYQFGLSPDHDKIGHIYNNSAFRGFSISADPPCVSQFSQSPDVFLHIEKSATIKSMQPIQTRIHSTWGLQRISSSTPVNGNSSLMEFAYSYRNANLGDGADVYIIDTGIDVKNQAFEGHAHVGYSFEQDSQDRNGHGTHVSGTAASYIFGVAPGANLIAVKVLGTDGDGTTASTIAGIDFVVTEHERRKEQRDFIGSVMNMSWGITGISESINHALNSAVSQGIHAAVAAGNDGSNACNNSPASSGGNNSSSIITVGSIGETSEISSFSNTGPCVDIYAPGENVLSTWLGQNAANYLDGTSMATPHVTGIIAYLMVSNPELAQNPSAMKMQILKMALTNIVSGNPMAGDNMKLLNNGVMESG